MKKAASVFLRKNIDRQDMMLLAQWLGNGQITRYLNEHGSSVYELSRLADTVPEPMLGYHLNRHGHFFMICPGDGQAIGFVKLARTAVAGEYEIVYAIGEESLWGQGYGKTAIGKALTFAFADLRAVSVISPRSTRRIPAPGGWRRPAASGRWGCPGK